MQEVFSPVLLQHFLLDLIFSSLNMMCLHVDFLGGGGRYLSCLVFSEFPGSVVWFLSLISENSQLLLLLLLSLFSPSDFPIQGYSMFCNFSHSSRKLFSSYSIFPLCISIWREYFRKKKSLSGKVFSGKFLLTYPQTQWFFPPLSPAHWWANKRHFFVCYSISVF